MKKVISLILVLVMLMAVSVTAFAAEPRAAGASPSLYFTGTTAHCEVTIMDLNKQIIASMTLWDGNDCIAIWPGSGTSVVEITGTCTVEPGKTYTLKVTGTSGGKTLSVEPVTATCN